METFNFDKIAPYLKDPLVLIGLFIFLGLIFLRSLVKKGIIPVLQKNQGFNILKIILLYGFVIGLLIIILGFWLKAKQINNTNSAELISIIHDELQSKNLSESEKDTIAKVVTEKLKEKKLSNNERDTIKKILNDELIKKELSTYEKDTLKSIIKKEISDIEMQVDYAMYEFYDIDNIIKSSRLGGS